MILREIFAAAGVFVLLGALMGLLLATATKLFRVKRDERAVAISEILPGANCGGCGYAGCAALAEAIARGEAKISACTVGGDAVATSIAEVMGVDAESAVKQRAFVSCAGCDGVAAKNYIYEGVRDCAAAASLGGGGRTCSAGCVGLGTCAARCPFGAISVLDGVAHVDASKCVGCGVCVSHCPRNLIKLIPAGEDTVAVTCSNTDSGRAVRSFCEVGCIACKLCVRVCEAQAVTVEGNLARIDFEKCTRCGKCAEKCPRGVIKING